MALDPQIAAVLEARRDLDPWQAGEPTVAAVRAGTGAYLKLQGGPRAVARVTRVTVPGPGGRLPLRIYHPFGAPPFACLVQFHGGGWVAGDLDLYDIPARWLADASGCVIITVDYRRAPEHPFPAPLDDCLAAVRWTADNAWRIGVDPQRIGVMGDSAGGNLAAAVSLRARDEGGPDIRLQVLVYPATDAACATPSYETYAVGYGLESRMMRWYWERYLADPADAGNALASPLRAADLTGLPPTAVMTAEYDPLRDDGERYAARLRSAGVPVTLTRYGGMVHAFFLMGGVVDRTAGLVGEIVREARQAFAPAGSLVPGTGARLPCFVARRDR
ncbi:alpha/beta hydrolase [Sphaerimonospora mesophila]|uniref:alpha/beta hydrolase n=1 Tax=Sphaerimonospora mesophila TaxID=37483 RepID=UPI0006E38094